jgi:hypothetical protein
VKLPIYYRLIYYDLGSKMKAIDSILKFRDFPFTLVWVGRTRDFPGLRSKSQEGISSHLTGYAEPHLLSCCPLLGRSWREPQH